MYLSSKEADIIESPETIKTYKPSSLVKINIQKYVSGMSDAVMEKK